MRNYLYLYRGEDAVYPMRNERNIAPLFFGALLLASLIVDWSGITFPLDIFRFPANLLSMVLWLAVAIELYRQRAKWAISRFLLSQSATTLSLVVMVALGIVFGFQLRPATTSFTAIVAILFLMTHLALITIRGWRNERGIRWRFMVNHLGLLIAIGSAFWGAPDRVELRAVVEYSKPTTEAYDLDGRLRILDKEMQLEDFVVDYYDNGTPERFEAKVRIGEERATIRVNKPYNISLSESVYLVSYDTATPDESQYCIVEVVRDPWRYAKTAGIALMLVGAVMMFVGRATRKKS